MQTTTKQSHGEASRLAWDCVSVAIGREMLPSYVITSSTGPNRLREVLHTSFFDILFISRFVFEEVWNWCYNTLYSTSLDLWLFLCAI